MASLTPKSAVKIVNALVPDDFGNTAPNATQCLNVDTLGFRWATFVVQVGNVAGTSITCKVQESSDNFVSDAASDITGASIPVWGDTDDSTLKSITIDLQRCERYLQLAFTYGSITASDVSACCILWGATDSLSIGTAGVQTNATGPFPV
jgi:hypothetical protein